MPIGSLGTRGYRGNTNFSSTNRWTRGKSRTGRGIGKGICRGLSSFSSKSSNHIRNSSKSKFRTGLRNNKKSLVNHNSLWTSKFWNGWRYRFGGSTWYRIGFSYLNPFENRFSWWPYNNFYKFSRN